MSAIHKDNRIDVSGCYQQEKSIINNAEMIAK